MPNVDFGIWGASAWINPPGGVVGAAIASSATIAPTTPMVPVSGTESITTITVPYTGFVGRIVLLATGAWTMTTTGNIATVFTAVASQAVVLWYDGTSWYPQIAD